MPIRVGYDPQGPAYNATTHRIPASAAAAALPWQHTQRSHLSGDGFARQGNHFAATPGLHHRHAMAGGNPRFGFLIESCVLAGCGCVVAPFVVIIAAIAMMLRGGGDSKQEDTAATENTASRRRRRSGASTKRTGNTKKMS